jgi:hypothetical protein
MSRVRYDVSVKYNITNDPIDVLAAGQEQLNIVRYSFDGTTYTMYAGDSIIPNNSFVGCPSPTCVYPIIKYDINIAPQTLTAGQTAWNSTEGTLDLGMGSNVTQQIGMETYYRVENHTGSTINDGTVVSAVGTLGNSGKILISPAIANGTQGPEDVMGITTHDTTNGSSGLVTCFGLVRGINTTGSSVGETWVDGDKLWVHPTIPGKLTKVRPTSPNMHVLVALVIHAHSNGSIFVRVTNGQALGDLHDVYTTNQQDGDALVWNSTNNRYQINTVKPRAVAYSDLAIPKVGEIRYDSNFIYVRVDSNTWKKSALITV